MLNSKLVVMKRIAVGLVFFVLAAWLISSSLVTYITPREMTVTAIGETFYRIHLYAQSNGELPETVADLPVREGYANRTQDGWGSELAYKVNDNGIVTLTSLGADNLAGGIGDDADITRSHRSLDESGKFIAGEELWTVTSEVQSGR